MTRKTFEQPLNADKTNYKRGLYDPIPAFEIDKQIESGYHRLAQKIFARKNKLRLLILDGYQGVNWDEFRHKLDNNLVELGLASNWLNIEDCYADPVTIKQRTQAFMGGDDRVFGQHYPLGVEYLFDAKKLAEYRIKVSKIRSKSQASITIVYGVGASLVELWDSLWYIEVPKDIIQKRYMKHQAGNTGLDRADNFEQFYKRSYFIEWPALNRLKRRFLPDIDLFIDNGNQSEPTFIKGDDFRNSLKKISHSPFRVRPWFSPGPWGGKYMQDHMGLDPDEPNFAWSFELITPENGIQLEIGKKRLEFSFDFLMDQENENVLGKEAAEQFIYEWPIRLDYLDTIDGGNLSVQCHPRPAFIRENFGETYTQDESYYILNSKPGSKVYLGLQENCDPEEFRQKLEKSDQTGQKVNIDKYVNSVSSQPHDLFNIPNGTVHGSGQDNLVLEISATPYIFTFKLYDWVRKDLKGKMRPLNIERAWENIYSDRRSAYVEKNLIASPKLVEEGEGWQKYVLESRKQNWWQVHRIEFDNKYSQKTQDKAFAINLVEGEKCRVTTKNGVESEIAFAESLVIPAAAEQFQIKNTGRRKCKVIMVSIRNGVGTEIPL